MHDILSRLKQNQVTLPKVTPPVANYVPYLEQNGLVFISGQLPFQEGKLLYPGEVGKEVSLEQAQEAARLCGLHLLAQVEVACGGDWERLLRCVKIGGFVQASHTFTQHPEVINGASNLMVEILGDKGRHTRFAVGASSLPRNACVEIEGLFAIRP